LITAALLTAQAPVGPAPAAGYSTYGEPAASRQFVPVSDGSYERRGLLSRLGQRLHNLFGPSEDQAYGAPVRSYFQAPVIQQQGPAPAPGEISEEQSAPVEAEPPLAGQPQKATAPAPIPVTDAQGLPPGAQVIEGPLPTGAEVIEEPARKLPAQAGHDEPYHRITGRLAFVPSGGGTWLIRYADEGADRFGGLVELSTAASMTDLHNGDLVTAEGEMLNADAGSGLRAPLFRAHTVRLVEHVQ
jgi:hypothetical protein